MNNDLDKIKRLYMDEYTKQSFEKIWNVSHKKTDISPVKVIKNAIVLPPNLTVIDHRNFEVPDTGIIDEQRKYVEGSGVQGIPVKNKIVLPQKIDFIDKDVLWGGMLLSHWGYGHFLMQYSNRLYHYYKQKDKSLSVVFSVLDKNLPKYIWDFFDLIGLIHDKVLLVDKHTKFKTIICPPISSHYCVDWTDDFLIPFKEVAKNIAPLKYEKVYFTRRHWKNAKCFGEDKIEKVFNQNGFKSIAPECLSLKEQIAIIKGAKQIAGISGTAFHNILFCDKTNLKLIILNRNEEFNCQYIVNEAVNADWYVIKVYANPLPVLYGRGPFIVGVSDYLKQFLIDHNMKNHAKEFKPAKYVKKFMRDYCLTYNVKAYTYDGKTYTYTNANKFLSIAKKDKIDSIDVIRVLQTFNSFKLTKFLYYIMYKLTFGKVRCSYKERYFQMRDFLNQNIQYKH